MGITEILRRIWLFLQIRKKALHLFVNNQPNSSLNSTHHCGKYLSQWGLEWDYFHFKNDFNKTLTQICFAFVYEQGFSTYSLSIIHAKPGFHRHDCF